MIAGRVMFCSIPLSIKRSKVPLGSIQSIALLPSSTLRIQSFKVHRIQQIYSQLRGQSSASMTSFYTSETPDYVKGAKGIHLMTANTPNGQKVQILLEELALKYGTTWTFNIVKFKEN